MATETPRPNFSVPRLDPQHFDDIAELSSLYLSESAEAKEFTEEQLFENLAELFELSLKQDSKMKKEHAEKIEGIVMGASTVVQDNTARKSQQAAAGYSHSPKMKGFAARSEGILIEAGNIALKRIDSQVENNLSRQNAREYARAKEKMQGIEKKLESWVTELKLELAGAEGRKAQQVQNTLDAIGKVQSLLEHEKQAFCDWAEKLNVTKKFNAGQVVNYFVRMSESQAIFSTKENIRAIAQGIAAAPTLMPPDLQMLPEKVSAGDRAQLNELMQSRGLTLEKVNDINSADFINGYAMLRQHFPPDELDRTKDIIAMIKEDPSYYLIVAKDKNGKIVGACDGNFVADRQSSSMYWAHVAVPGEERRAGIATLLYASTLSLGNQMAEAAEKELGTTYQKNMAGKKLTLFFLESEAANLADKESAILTMGRLQFHSSLDLCIADNGLNLTDKSSRKPISKKETQANAALLMAHMKEQIENYYDTSTKEGAAKAKAAMEMLSANMEYIVGSLKQYQTFRYAQVDLDWASGTPFQQKEWNTVPLFLAFRSLIAEPTSQDAFNAIRLQRNAFLNAGTLNDVGIWFDYAFGVAGLVGKDVSIARLPSTDSELREFMNRAGNTKLRLDLYPQHNWYLHPEDGYLAALKESGTPLTADQAMRAYEQHKKERKSTVPASL